MHAGRLVKDKDPFSIKLKIYINNIMTLKYIFNTLDSKMTCTCFLNPFFSQPHFSITLQKAGQSTPSGGDMSITLIGGIDRLKQDYIKTAKKRGVELKCILHDTPDFKARIGSPDAVVIFTKQISHEARRKALEHAKAQNIQVHMLHSCSVSSLSKCFNR